MRGVNSLVEDALELDRLQVFRHHGRRARHGHVMLCCRFLYRPWSRAARHARCLGRGRRVAWQRRVRVGRGGDSALEERGGNEERRLAARLRQVERQGWRAVESGGERWREVEDWASDGGRWRVVESAGGTRQFPSSCVWSRRSSAVS